MNGIFQGKFASQIHHFAKAFTGLLSPSAGNCIYCRAAIRGSSALANPLGLCSACYERIPWIRDIYCSFCGRYETCHDCKRWENAALQRNRSAVRYDATMKEWLSLFKYRGDERLLQLFAEMLMHAYHKLLEGEDTRDDPFNCIAFVPLSSERLMERGFNQAELLAREIGARIGTPVAALLTRVRHTHKQSFKRRSERLQDLGGAFAIDPLLLNELQTVKPLRILLIDDVYTTGSTLNQCASVIREHTSAQVYGLTWAR